MLLSISLFFLQISVLFKRHANQIMKPLCFPTAIAEIFSIFHYRQSSTVIAHFKRNNRYKSWQEKITTRKITHYLYIYLIASIPNKTITNFVHVHVYSWECRHFPPIKRCSASSFPDDKCFPLPCDFHTSIMWIS